jgi:uncharacterized membrane protein YedE/YeeE
MQDIDIGALATQVLWTAFGLSVVLGAIMQRTHFCTMGAVSDIVNMGDWARMRMWVMAMGVAMIGFNAMVALGWIDASKSIYAGPRLIWLSALVGGAMFGFGMVLASGCGSKTLVRIGSGNLKSAVVFVVLGIAAFATLKGITAVARVDTVDKGCRDARHRHRPAVGPRGDDRLVEGDAWPRVSASVSAARWSAGPSRGRGPLGRQRARRHRGRRGDRADVVGLGPPRQVAEDPSTLQEAFVATNSQRMESLSFVSPIAYTLDWLMFFSDKAKLLTIGIVSVCGVVVGAALQALLSRSFRWEGLRDAEIPAGISSARC